MIIYKLSFFAYLKEKIKETLSFSGSCKGDIFLNPALKEGRDILREHYHDDHIIHAIKHFATRDGYGEVYRDLKAGFGAIATEVAVHFRQNILYEPDEVLRGVLTANMVLKGTPGQWEILTDPSYGAVKEVVRCEAEEDLTMLLEAALPIIIFQNKHSALVSAPHHDLYHYCAEMNKDRPFKTLWILLIKGYAFRLKKITSMEHLAKGDYIFLPKGIIDLD